MAASSNCTFRQTTGRVLNSGLPSEFQRQARDDNALSIPIRNLAKTLE
jgi:hypothetical protein